MKHFLITGASGFLGQNLLRALRSQTEKQHYYLLSRHTGQPAADSQWLQGSVESFTAPSDIKLDGIFHLAALVKHSRKDQADVFQTNVNGTLNMVMLAAQHRCRLVFVSTSGVVGCFDQLTQQADEDDDYAYAKITQWPYYHSKMQAEVQARELARKHNVELVIVRPPVLLGPGDILGRSTHLISQLLGRRLPVILKGGYHFVDIRDVANALLRAMTISQPRPIYHLPGTSSTLKQFCERVGEIAAVSTPRWQLAGHWLKPFAPYFSFIPDPVVLEMGSSYWGLTSKYSAKDLQYLPRSAEITLRETIADLQNRPSHH